MADVLPTTLAFTLIAPEKVLASRNASMVTLPGSEGMLGILPGHAPLITALKSGVVTVEGGDGADEHIFVAGGFAEVTNSGLTILADEAVPVSDLDAAKLEAAIAQLEADITQPLDEADRLALEGKLMIAQAQHQAQRLAKAA